MTARNVVEQIRRELHSAASAKRAPDLQWFFKTGKGEYGEGDVFLGVTVPLIRKVAGRHKGAGIPAARILLRSRIHEERLLALLLLIREFQHGDQKTRSAIFQLYLKNTRHINNWDLVDLSAPSIVGGFLESGDRSILDTLARSASLWERRISILATLHFIRMKDFEDTLRIARLLLHDDHDLIHKAVGWMLREIGEKDRAAEERFLRQHFATMPRTMLRYAIEKFSEAQRKRYLTRKE